MNVCRLIGHRWDCSGDIAICSRCGACPYYYGDEDEDPWHIMAFWCLRRRIRDLGAVILCWFRPCPYCGMRFGRHDPNELPF